MKNCAMGSFLRALAVVCGAAATVSGPPATASAQAGGRLAAVRAPLEVAISVEVEAPSNPVVSGTTNLPDGTELMVTVNKLGSEPGTVIVAGQTKVAVSGGRFRAGPFSDNQAPYRRGRYQAEVTMPVTLSQPTSVQRVIGDKGEWLAGHLLVFGRWSDALGPTARVFKPFQVAE